MKPTRNRLITMVAIALAAVLTFALTSMAQSSPHAATTGGTSTTAAGTNANTPVGTTPNTQSAATAADQPLDPGLATVLLYPSAAHNFTADQIIKLYQHQSRLYPNDTSYLDRLADAYIEKARQNGDVTYYNLADAALQKALAIDPHDAQAITYSGWVRLSWHQFGEAVTLARRSIAIDPHSSESYGVLGDGLMEMGQYDAATQAYQTMDSLRPGLTTYNRLSYIDWLHGNVKGSLRLMAAAIDAGTALPENLAWCQVQQGNTYFAIGDLKHAEAQYHAALQTFPNYIHALAGLAQVRAAQHRNSDAIGLYQQAIAIVPLPQYVTALGDLQAILGHHDQANAEYALVEFVDKLYKLNHVQFGIDRAFFLADHDRSLPEAVGLARTELLWRHDIRTEDSAAWVFYKAGLLKDALATERQALRLGTKEALYQFHLGMILEKLGQPAQARIALHTALQFNPYFSPRYVPVARAALARLGG